MIDEFVRHPEVNAHGRYLLDNRRIHSPTVTSLSATGPLRKRIVIAVAAVGCLGVSAAAFAIAGHPKGAIGGPNRLPPVRYTPTSAPIPATASPASAKATGTEKAASVLTALAGSHVRGIAIGDGSGPTSAPTIDIALVIDKPADEMEALWESDLVVGAVADSMAVNPDQSQNVSRVTVKATDATGASIPDLQTGIGSVVARQEFTPLSDDAVAQRIKSAEAATGLRVTDLTILRPYGDPAPSVTFVATDRAQGARAYTSAVAAISGGLDARDPVFEGYDIRIVDGRGAMIVEGSAAFRTGAGRLTYAPDVEAEVRDLHTGVPRNQSR